MNQQQREDLSQWIQGTMLNPSQLENLFLLLVQAPEDELVAEALENCVASTDCIPSLEKYVQSDKGDQAYWSATFLGRLGTLANSSQHALTSLVCNNSQPAATRQRAVWALQQIGSLAESTYSQLHNIDCHGDARMKRLLDQVFKQAV